MPRRPRAERETASAGLTPAVRPDESEAAAESVDDPGGGKPDLDERERRQSPQRKAAGPGRPSRPAAAPHTRADADGLIESWGTEPCAMPPTDPEPS